VHNPVVEAASVPERHPLRLAALVTAGVVAILAAAAVILFFWLRTYAPLGVADGRGSFAPGPGLGADVEPVTGSGGKPVFIPAYRAGQAFDTAFTVHNDGRFAVDVLGLGHAAAAAELQAIALLATDSSSASADPSGLRQFSRLRLDRGDTAILVVRWRLDCSKSQREVTADTVPLRYTYLSMFTRTERVRLPFAVTLRCSGGPLPTP
jgi:hypothetical protein